MLPVLPVFLDCNNRGGSIRPNPEGWIIENRKAEFFWPLGQNRKAEYDRKAENQSTLISAQYINILSGNWTTYISGLMVKFGLPVFYHFGLMVKNSAFQFSYDPAFRIRPNGPVRNNNEIGLKRMQQNGNIHSTILDVFTARLHPLSKIPILNA